MMKGHRSPTPMQPRTPSLPVDPDLPEDGLLVGWSLEAEHQRVPVGFRFAGASTEHRRAGEHLDPILFTAEGHLITIAPTGAGKGIGALIPTLLRHPGQVIVIDPKGENYRVTAARRRAMGQRVVLFDPFGITGEEACNKDGFNPLDLLKLDSPVVEEDAFTLAAMLVAEKSMRDPFWDNMARHVVTALMLHIVQSLPGPLRNLGELHYLLNQARDGWAVTLLEMERSKLAPIRLGGAAISGWEPKVRASIMATAQSHVGFLRGSGVQGHLTRTTFEVQDFVDGAPMSIYLVLPPERLDSHAALLRLWVGSLVSLVLRRRHPPQRKTLFLLDEAAQLGPLDQFRQAVTLLRGYGLQTWSFWQDFSQLQRLYPEDWETIFNNCKVFQAFGFNTFNAARAAAQAAGHPDPQALFEMDADEMMLMIAGDEPVIAQRPNYLIDAPFEGLFEPNPYHTPDDLDAVTPRLPQREYRRPGAVAEEEPVT